ncbi:hypothetical protein [Paracoccus sp. TOH]|uniref:hypothetical protein n=1 Tax=Paracoccus sp. TOH TaxID=1263728 RepID=UPI0025B066F4|nr:hypothetical protein [Paracoccus sp. TOH]WJS87245.1 hypothetical protein NBE95_20415 [Paracoccus sp. TOH]
MAKRGRKAQLRHVKTYLNPESEVEAGISEFVDSAVRMRSSAAVRAMLTIAWERMQDFDRAEFDRHFSSSHNYSTFERVRSKHHASIEADSLLSNPPTPKIK